MSVANLCVFITFQVTFVGERAIDYGGTRREFFCLLAAKAPKSMFIGSDNMKFFSMDTEALQVCKKLHHLLCFSRKTFITIYHKLSIL